MEDFSLGAVGNAILEVKFYWIGHTMIRFNDD